MNVECYKAAFVYIDGKFEKDKILEISQGVIQKVTSLSAIQEKSYKDLGHVALLPGTVNTHNHSFQSLVRGFGDDLSFFDWRDQGIYKYSLNLTQKDIYTGALFAFGEMLKHGITTVCDFFYIQDEGNDNAKAVIRAAKDLGIRLVLARCFYDWQTAPKRYREKVSDAKSRCMELIEEFKEDTTITICPAPHSPHAASEKMIQAAYEVAKLYQTHFHIHVAEARYEVESIQTEKGLRPLFYLDRLGVVDEPMVLVHGVWLSDAELDLMAQKKVKLSYNPSSNMFLADGVTPIRKMLDRGITIGLGTDGACSNNKTSIFEEMRMAALLQKVHLLDATSLCAENVFTMGTESGGKVLGLPIGKIGPGYKADFVTVSLDRLELHPLQNLAKNLVYSFSDTVIEDVFVEGKKVLSHGEMVTVPERDIVQQVRRVTEKW